MCPSHLTSGTGLDKKKLKTMRKKNHNNKYYLTGTARFRDLKERLDLCGNNTLVLSRAAPVVFIP
jgi:hypothetical protein